MSTATAIIILIALAVVAVAVVGSLIWATVARRKADAAHRATWAIFDQAAR